MGEECAIVGGDDFELSLELSIGGGKYGISTSNHSSCSVDLQRRLKISRKIESLVEETRKRRRGIGEIDGFLGERIRKNEKGGGGFSINHDADDEDLSLSLFTQNKRFRDCSRLLYSQVQSLSAHPNHPSSSSSSSAVSDYQTTSQRGGSSTDSGGHSSPLQGLRPYHNQHLQSNDSSCLSEPDHHRGVAPAKLASPPPWIQSQPRWGPSPDNPKVASNTHFYQTTKDNNNNACLAYPGPVKPVEMPCVTTTGNGPNGRTVRGFLYKYTNAEVSIVCVCHGNSFSPSGFVEHAGGVGVSHPLRHITVVRSAFR